MKTSELTGDALNAIIKRIVLQDGLYTQHREIYTLPYIDPDGWVFPANTSINRVHKVPPKFTRPPTTGKFDPLNNENQCIHIAAHYGVANETSTNRMLFGLASIAVVRDSIIRQEGSTCNEAALRAVVALRLGDEVPL